MGKKWVREAREAKYAPLDYGDSPRKRGDKRRGSRTNDHDDVSATHEYDWRDADSRPLDDR